MQQSLPYAHTHDEKEGGSGRKASIDQTARMKSDTITQSDTSGGRHCM